MTRAELKGLAYASILAASFMACAAAPARANTLSVTMTFVDLPSTITLCRDQAAARAYRFDEEWPVLIDVDNNLNTGDPNSSGADALLLVETTPQSATCTTTPDVSTQQNLVSFVLVWDAALQRFVDSGAPATLALDFASHAMTVSAAVAGPLASLSQQSRIFLATYATYTPTGSTVYYARDNSAVISLNGAVADPVADVLQCTAPCSQSVPWIQMIDLVALSAHTSVPPPFGDNTVNVEFDVADLPTTLDLCRYPAQFTSSSGLIDSQWLAALDLDGNINTGDTDGADALVIAATTRQPQNCSPHTVPTNEATFFAELEKWDATQQGFVYVGDLPVTVDTVTNKIIVQADRTSPALAGLSTQSRIEAQTGGLYDSGNPNSRYAYDVAGPSAFGSRYTDPGADVQNCVASCSPTASWYAQIDLVGGSVKLADVVFQDGFE